MVWLYGGGFQIGEATRDIYAPDYFMKEEVLLVTVNYRLGAFGKINIFCNIDRVSKVYFHRVLIVRRS